ncbi:MAG: hypothetical protein FJW30_17175, partial [Acidobacteria bacterium]|nr:hypothetical protein [Acidobacteriota bacterium]
MDLGSLELQIFVSLTVVLGAAFVALVCDYLKGNNEQLREHNIELRVRREEQERQMLLDPSGFAAQYSGQRAVVAPAAPAAKTPVPVDAAMRSHADPADLEQVAARAEALSSRTSQTPSPEDPSIPDVAAPRRNRRTRLRPDAPPAENKYADWVRPEVIARIARRAETTEATQSVIHEDVAIPVADSAPKPLNAAEKWDIRDKITPPPAAPIAQEPEPVIVEPPAPALETLPPSEAVALQKEIERVAQMERPVQPPSNGVILRPLTLPALKLEEELARLTDPDEKPLAVAGPIHSALLEEVIAASVTKPGEDIALNPSPTLIQLASAAEPEPVEAKDQPIFLDVAPPSVMELPPPQVVDEPAVIEVHDFAEPVAELELPEPAVPVSVQTQIEPEPADLMELPASQSEDGPAVFEIPEFAEPAAEVQVFEPVALAVAPPQVEPEPVYAFEPPPAELAEEPAVFEIPEFAEPAAEVQVFEPAAQAVAPPKVEPEPVYAFEPPPAELAEEPAVFEIPEFAEPAAEVQAG